MRSIVRRQYNSAWPEDVCTRRPGSSDSTMKTNDGGRRAPIELSAFIDGVPVLAWTAEPNGFPEFFNQRFPDYSGLSPDQIRAGWKSTLHPDDVQGFEEWWQGLQESQKPG